MTAAEVRMKRLLPLTRLILHYGKRAYTLISEMIYKLLK